MVPKISVITTVFNCERFIRQSLESILNQTFRDFEYIVVNDGSTDNTLQKIREIASADDRIILIDNKTNIGRVKSLNTALENVKSSYIAIQDADDISLPERLEKQYNFLENNKDYVLAGANIIVMDEFENFISKPERPIENDEAKFSLLFRCTFANPSIMFRKKVIDENNIKYEDNFIHAEDFRIITLISRHGKVYNLKEPLVKYRKHSFNNSMVNFDILNSGSIIIVKENLAGLGIDAGGEQIYRIRNLISSRGINKNFLYEDLKLLLKAIKAYREKCSTVKNREILLTLRRMLNWIGRKNVTTKLKYQKLYLVVFSYYLKETLINRKLQ
jgi:glycosyltransferase involved in cell wall biosynthesis